MWQVLFARDLNTVQPGTIVIATCDKLMITEAQNEHVPILSHRGLHTWKDLLEYRPTPPCAPAMRLKPEDFSFWKGNVIKTHGGWTQAYTDPPPSQSPMEDGEVRESP